MTPELLFDSESIDSIPFDLKIEFICEKLSLDYSSLNSVKDSIDNIMLSDVVFKDMSIISLIKALISEKDDINPDFIKIYNSEELYNLEGVEYINTVYLLCYDFFKVVVHDPVIPETIKNVINGC